MAPAPKSNGSLKQGSLFSFFTKKASATTKSPSPPNKSAARPAAAATTTAKTPTNSSSKAAKKKNPLLEQVKVGGRVEVYWKNDDEYYAARVTRQNDGQFLLEYEADGESEWIDLGQETFRVLEDISTQPKKKRRIQEEDDHDEFSEEVEFEGDDDGEESAYEEGGDNVEEEDEDGDEWMVTDEDEEQGDAQVAKQGKKNKNKKLPKAASAATVKVTKHTTNATTPVFQNKPSSLNHFGHTPKAVTPTLRTSPPALPSSGNNSIHSPLASPPANKVGAAVSAAPPAFVKDALNPTGSHVHNHLGFLRSPRDASGRSPDHPDYDPRTLKVVASDWVKVTGKAMTDCVEQWWDLKSQYNDSLLLFKTGKFYEMYHMDADVGVQVLGLMYMKGHMAHAGFPEISYGAMADKLVRAGYKVARVEQTETPEQLKVRKQKKRSGGSAPKVVNREVCSVLTLGTRTFCYLDEDTAGILERGDEMVGPLLAIREVLLEETAAATEPDQVMPTCEYGVTLVDAMRGTVTIGQFADDVLRSRMTTLLTAFAPSEILLQGGNGASQTLQSLIRSVQANSPHPFRLEIIQSDETFPKSTALDAQVRRELERGRGQLVHPWDVEETIQEVHRRKYYPRASKNQQENMSVARWPKVLQAAVQGKADLALSSFGATLYYLQRNLIDAELLSMGIVKAYIPLQSSSTSSSTSNEASTSIQQLASQESRVESGVDETANLISPSQATSPVASYPSTFEMMPDQESLNIEDQVNHMALDGTTLHNLEILTNSVDYKTKGSLWSKINYTKTPHGSRLLRAWLLRPLFRKTDIERRADAVEQLASGAGAVALSEATSVLSKCGDIERLLSRVHSMSGVGGADQEDGPSAGIHPNERAVLYETLTYTKRKVGDFAKVLNGLRCATQIPEIFDGIDLRGGLLRKIVCHPEIGGCFPDMVEELDWFFANFDCDQAAKGLFEPSRGIDARYDEACETIDRIQNDLNEYKTEMCSSELTPRSLAKSAWTYVNTKPESKDKYLIELPASIAVPDDFIMKGKRGSGHKQANKYRTAVVQGLVDELELALDIQKERKARGMQLIFAKFDSKRTLWAAAAQTTALLDALSSLAQVASKPGFTRPRILDCPLDGSPSIRVTQGRHPCVENTLSSSEFVPNDISLGSATENGPSPRVLLLSGPNMGGKSTLLRQTCLISILSQIGSYVPAQDCELTPIDRIYTRLGASDRILMGQSTFFVELAETAAALRGATRRSLVIMDELGRGTSTFDGTAIASAAVKHLVERSKCLSLFATHYHSLLDEWKHISSVKLGHMECVVDNGEVSSSSGEAEESNITFLYTLGTGVCPKSFGINVARLAGLPEDVLVKAKRISDDFEREIGGEDNQSRTVTARTAPGLKQMVIESVEKGDWDQVKALWTKLKEL